MKLAIAILLVAAPARAETFGGFSGIGPPYLVDQDRVCAPLLVNDGAATGMPACGKATADTIANLSIKAPIIQRGAKAAFAATASATTLTVSNQAGDAVVTWTAPDPIGKVVEVYASQYEDRIAVAYTVRRLGKEITAVVAFALPKAGAKPAVTATPNASTGTAPADDPKLAQLVAAAAKAPKTKALVAWKAVLVADAAHSQALYQVAALELAAKHQADALASLAALAASTRGDAIEWLVEARFDPAFAALRADPKFRGAVGLDRKPATVYERVMGFGGQFEQTGTSCDKAEIRVVLARDRSAKIKIRTSCEGDVHETTGKGTWRLDGDGIVVALPNGGQAPTTKDETPCKLEKAGDEEALHCSLGHDLEFVALPTRR